MIRILVQLKDGIRKRCTDLDLPPIGQLLFGILSRRLALLPAFDSGCCSNSTAVQSSFFEERIAAYISRPCCNVTRPRHGISATWTVRAHPIDLLDQPSLFPLKERQTVILLTTLSDDARACSVPVSSGGVGSDERRGRSGHGFARVYHG
jgi:hypothetical protein